MEWEIQLIGDRNQGIFSQILGHFFPTTKKGQGRPPAPSSSYIPETAAWFGVIAYLHLMVAHNSQQRRLLGSNYLLDLRPLPEGSCEIGFVRPSFRLLISFLGIGSLAFSET